MFDRNLIDYLPPVLRDVDDFIAISDAVQPEIKKAWDSLASVMNNQFIDTADDVGISVWEKELGIVPSKSESLEYRRQRIKIAQAFGVVYTLRWLTDWAKSFYNSNLIQVSTEDYFLKISIPVSENWLNVYDMLRDKIPQNMMIKPTLIYSRPLNFKLKTAVHTTLKTQIKSEVDNE